MRTKKSSGTPGAFDFAKALSTCKELRKLCVTGPELLNRKDEPIAWFWEGVIQDLDQVELSGPSESGKSTLTFLLHAAALAPKPVELFGRRVTPVPAGKISVLVNVEQQANSIARKLVEACQALDLDPAQILSRLLIVPRSEFKIGHPAFEQLCNLIVRNGAGLVSLDSRARITQNADAHGEQGQAQVAEMFGRLADAAKCPVVTVSHVRKANQQGQGRRSLSLDDVAGHHQRGAGADTVLLIEGTRDANGAVISSKVKVAKMRDDGGAERLPVIEFSIVREPGVPARIAVGQAASSQASDAPAHERVHALLKAQGERTKQQIREALGMGPKPVEKALSVLFAERRITKRTAPHPKNGQETDYFAVKLTRADIDEDLADLDFAGPQPSENDPDRDPDRG